MRKLIFFEGMKKNLSLLMAGIVIFLFSKEAVNAQVWRDTDGDGLFEIVNINQLDSIRNNLTGTCPSPIICTGYELTRSLDFKDRLSYRDTTGKLSAFTKGSGWNPIGTSTPTAFNSIFEGNGYTIDNLYINKTTDYVGLFGWTEVNTRIRNIGVTNVSVSGDYYVGALVGYNSSNGTITKSYATGSVTGSNWYVGGLVGENIGIITQSYATGNVTSTSNNVGGLVGDNSGTITQSYATGSVTGSSDKVGGLVGYNSGTITQSYAIGNVTGLLTGSSNVGGLVGTNVSGGTITQTYATGNVTGFSDVGGLVGNNSGTITHGYWNSTAVQTVGVTTPTKVGIGTGTGTFKFVSGLILSDMKSPTATASDTIQKLGPGFIYKQGQLPKLHLGARISVNTINFTQTVPVPSITNIVAGSSVANIYQGTATTRATLTVGGIAFTANIIGVTNILSPFTLANIQYGVKKLQAITFTSIGNKTYGNSPFVLHARSSAGLKVSFSASNNLVGIRNDTLTIKQVGTVNITAYSENDSTFGFTNQSITINKAYRSINFGTLAQKTFGNKPFVLSATSSASLRVLYSASDTLLVSIKNDSVTIKRVGTVIITAYQTENDSYLKADSVVRILTISKANQSIRFDALASKTFGDASFVLSPTSSAGLSVSYSASNTLVSISNDTVSINGAGTVSITAYQTGNENYLPAFATQTLIVVNKTVTTTKTTPTLTFTAIPNLTIGQRYMLVANSNSPVDITFTSSDNDKVSIVGNIATAKGKGNVTITANQAGNAEYNAATSVQNVTITDPTLPVPTISFTAIPNLTVGQKYTLVVSSNSPVAITFASSNLQVATVSGNTLTAVGTGTSVITANQAGNAEFNVASAKQTVTVINKTGTTPALTFVETHNNSIRIFPNPANDYITISYDKTQNVSSVKIYDMTGKHYELKMSHDELGIKVDVKHLPKGEYILVIYGEKGEVLRTEFLVISY